MIPELSEFFNEEYLRGYFEKHLRWKKGGGRDNLTPRKYYNTINDEFTIIINKCLTGTYKFSYYRERLVLKGKGKVPRVLSIPSVRDRLVLGVLNKYLQTVIGDKIKQDAPNVYIKQIANYIKEKEGDIVFYKTDYHDFYGSIRLKLLRHQLQKNNIPQNVISLLLNAVKTPTIGLYVPSDTRQNDRGIPQGLAISNILASTYMLDFDNNFGNKVAGLYIRYVDDTLYLSPSVKNIRREVTKNISKNKLGLHFSPEKVSYGIVGKTNLDFIGYVFKDINTITIRQKNIEGFLNNLARVASKCKDLFNNANLRPSFIKLDIDFFNYYVCEFNEMISGFRIDNHLYGWVAYFQAMNDVSLLYGMDRVIKNKLLKGLPTEITKDIHSLVKTYYDILKTGGVQYVNNLDDITGIEEKKHLLIKKGLLTDGTYTDDQVDSVYEEYINFIKRRTEANIGIIS